MTLGFCQKKKKKNGGKEKKKLLYLRNIISILKI